MNRRIIAAVAVIAIVGIGAAVYWSHTPQHHSPAPSNNPTQRNGSASAPQNKRPSPSQNQSRTQQHQEQAPAKPAASPAERYCSQAHDKADTKALSQSGGLVQIFQHESQLGDAYDCASTFLAHGGNVDATESGDDSEHLTPLLFAIKRNDTKMVHFMLDHGADPNKRAGPHHIRPYGYAISQAFKHQGTNYNKVIAILNSALGDKSSGTQQ